MKQNVSSSQFVDAIVGDDYNDMSYEGANALFEYLEELEDSIGEEIEFDAVAIRCEWAEYENLDAVLSDYDGYFDFTNYPIGGKFCRVDKDSQGLELYHCIDHESYKGINAIGKTKEGLDIAFNKEYIF